MTTDAANEIRPDLILLPLDDEFVAFSEMAQSLIGLNAAAADIVRDLQTGKSVADVICDVASQNGTTTVQAQEWLDGVRKLLHAGGLYVGSPPPQLVNDDDGPRKLPADMPPLEPFTAAVEQRYRLLDTCALIRYRHSAQARMVNTIIGHLAVEEETAPTLIIDIWATVLEQHVQSYIYCDGEPVGYTTRLSGVGPIVKSFLWRSAIQAHSFLFDIHAGVIGTGNGCVLFPAAPGSGKSSLTAAMTASGFRYFSDEVAMVETPELDVRPVPLAFCAKKSGWEVMSRYFPEILQAPTHRRADGKDVRYLPPPSHVVQRTPARMTHIVFPKFKADSETQLLPVARAEAFRRLMDECLVVKTRLRVEDVRRIVTRLSEIDCYALTFSSLDQAVKLVTNAIGAPPRRDGN